MMKPINNYKIALFAFSLFLLISGTSRAEFVQIFDDEWDGIGDPDFYWEYSVDMDGIGPGTDTFDFSVDFELWQEDAVYEYRYQIINDNDITDLPLQTVEIIFPGTIISYGSYGAVGGEITVSGPVVSGDTVYVGFNFPDYLTAGDLSNVFWIRSDQLPTESTLIGEGKGTPSASGDIPSPMADAPIPEPGTILLLGTGLLGLVGLGKKKYHRKMQS